MSLDISRRPETPWRDLALGASLWVMLLDGEQRRYVNLDNAATTPPLRAVYEATNEFLQWYSSVHRGAGFKSQLSTELYERARHIIAAFVGADLQRHEVVFVRNTTEAINQLAYLLRLRPDDVVITSIVEHHANMLPWRRACQVVYLPADAQGRLDVADLPPLLAKYGARIRLLAISGGSNVTGYLPPVGELARLAHGQGVPVFMDAAQLAPHRAIQMGTADDPARVDYLALSGHKMYAPYGAGALIGPREVFAQGDPHLVGGGAVELVTTDDILWTAPPDRNESGSPNVVGAVAMAAAARALMELGMDAVAAHERALTAYLLQRMQEIDGLRILGEPEIPARGDRLGVATFLMEGIPFALVAAILSCEFGVGVRHGCFCAHPYLIHLLGATPETIARSRAAILAGDKTAVPGAVRASLGLYNTTDDIDAFIAALQAIRAGNYQGRYVRDRATGDFAPANAERHYETLFAAGSLLR
jgi:cysteine desulfurase/selenocysteine lyase